MKKELVLATVLVGLLALSACSDSDNRAVSVDPGPSLALASIGSPPPTTYSPGEPVQFEFSIAASDIDAGHIGVNFYLIELGKAAQLDDNEEAETFDLGDFLIEDVEEGTTSYVADMLIPGDIDTAGDYLIVAFVDAAEVVTEDRNRVDNRSRNFSTGGRATYGDIVIDTEDHHDFIIHKVEVGKGFILLPEPEEGDHLDLSAPAHDESHIIGYIDATKLGNGVISARVAAEIVVGGEVFTAHLWHEHDDKFVDTMEIVFPNTIEEHYFPWDIAVNGQLNHALFEAYDPQADENTLGLRFTIIDTSDDVEHSEENNVLEIQVPYMFYQETDPLGEAELSVTTRMDSFRQLSGTGTISTTQTLTFSKGFDQIYGDKSKFAVGLDIGTEDWVKQSRFEARFDSSGAFNLWIFSHKATLLAAHATGYAYGDTAGAGYDVGVAFLGLDILSESDSVSNHLQKSWDRSWEEEQELFEASFTILIVPITVSAGISGSVGFGAGIGFDNLVISATGDIFSASIGAFATAEINLLIASGGVGGEFTIIAEDFSITGSADLSEALSSSRITLSVDIENELRAIQGDIYLFVKYPKYKFCCSVKQTEGRKTIYSTGALYDKTWTLFSDSKTLNF